MRTGNGSSWSARCRRQPTRYRSTRSRPWPSTRSSPLADWVTEAGTAVVYDGSVVVGLPTPVGAALRDVSPTNGGRVTGRRARTGQPS